MCEDARALARMQGAREMLRRSEFGHFAFRRCETGHFVGFAPGHSAARHSQRVSGGGLLSQPNWQIVAMTRTIRAGISVYSKSLESRQFDWLK